MVHEAEGMLNYVPGTAFRVCVYTFVCGTGNGRHPRIIVNFICNLILVPGIVLSNDFLLPGHKLLLLRALPECAATDVGES